MLALLRLVAVAGATTNWLVIFIAAVIAAFTLYVGIAMCATLRANDPDLRKIRYQVFRDLLHFFGGRWRQ